MYDTLAACLDDLYADANGSRLVQYTPVAGSMVTVSALIRDRAIEFADVFASTLRDGVWWEFRQDEVPTEPTEGAVIADGARTFRVRTVTTDWFDGAWLLFCQEDEAEIAIVEGQVAQLPSFLIAQY